MKIIGNVAISSEFSEEVALEALKLLLSFLKHLRKSVFLLGENSMLFFEQANRILTRDTVQSLDYSLVSFYSLAVLNVLKISLLYEFLNSHFFLHIPCKLAVLLKQIQEWQELTQVLVIS